jgi:hypothetical protein
MTFSYELGRPSLHFVKNHPAKFSPNRGIRFRSPSNTSNGAIATLMCSTSAELLDRLLCEGQDRLPQTRPTANVLV